MRLVASQHPVELLGCDVLVAQERVQDDLALLRHLQVVLGEVVL